MLFSPGAGTSFRFALLFSSHPDNNYHSRQVFTKRPCDTIRPIAHSDVTPGLANSLIERSPSPIRCLTSHNSATTAIAPPSRRYSDGKMKSLSYGSAPNIDVLSVWPNGSRSAICLPEPSVSRFLKRLKEKHEAYHKGMYRKDTAPELCMSCGGVQSLPSNVKDLQQ